MNASRRCPGFAAVFAFLMAVAVSAVAHADTYQLFGLGSGDRTNVVGITASGVVVLVYNVPVGAPLCLTSHICQEYETFVDGVMVKESPTAPALVYDNGSACSVSAPFLSSPVPGTCNNGHEVYAASLPGMPSYLQDTFTGPDPVADLFAVGPVFLSDVNLNASGDFVYNISHPTGGSGVFAEAIDLGASTPEPASIVLIGTGVVALAGSLRRRLFSGSHAG